MTAEVFLQKLDTIARCLTRLEEKMPRSADELTRDVDRQDIIMLNLERLVQISADIASKLIAEFNLKPVPATMAGGFETLQKNGLIDADLSRRLRKSVGFRNIAVHEYDKVSWEVVFSILTHHLNDFREYARAVQAHLEVHDRTTRSDKNKSKSRPPRGKTRKR